jgi:hypothetical protein
VDALTLIEFGHVKRRRRVCSLYRDLKRKPPILP